METRTDMAKSVVDFRDYANAREMQSENYDKSLLVTLILTYPSV